MDKRDKDWYDVLSEVICMLLRLYFLGAVFRNPEDLHLSETFRWAVEWGRKHMYTDPKSVEFLDYKIEFVTGLNFEHHVTQKGMF